MSQLTGIQAELGVQERNGAQHIFLKRNVDKIAVIYDTDNEAYSTAYLQAFLGEYRCSPRPGRRPRR